MNVKRPKRLNEETEDDLMEFQENFLKQNLQPSAKLVRKVASAETNALSDDQVNQKVKYAQSKDK